MMTRFKLFGMFVTGLLAVRAQAMTVKTETVVCNPAAVVDVPLVVSGTEGMTWLAVEIASDVKVAALLDVVPGTVAKGTRFSFSLGDDGSCTVRVLGFAAGAEGEVARLRFAVRDGTQGLYSDVTVTDVRCGDRSGVLDVTVRNPVTTVNGMIRVMASSADVTRLEEPLTVWPKTNLQTLSLNAGDALMASDDRQAISVASEVKTAERIRVTGPANGWQTGRYALLRTPTEELAFDVRGEFVSCTVTSTRADGLTTYWADVSVPGEVAVEASAGLDLGADTLVQVRTLIADDLAAHPEVTRVIITGDAATVPVAADLGIAPKLTVDGTTATATYAQPKMRITAFNPETGLVKIKVEPGEGNVIRTTLATGYVHVYGTGDLAQKMRRIAEVSFDLTPYLNPQTVGEADLTVTMGTHTFIRVKAEHFLKDDED